MSRTARVIIAEPASIRRGAAHLRAGELVAFPTETVYGLGADATSERAVAALYAAKGRPANNPLIVHLPDRETAAREGEMDSRALHLAARFWPGPLTLVLRRRADSRLAPQLSAGLDTVALRVPRHAVALALLIETARPVAAPSANPSGRLSPTRAAHVAEALGDKVAMILDGGPCPVGVESTVIDLSTPGPARLLRPGGVSQAAIEEQTGPLADAGEGPVRAPGMLASHYAPRLPLRLGARSVHRDEALLAFGPDAPEGAAETLNLSPVGNLEEAAANLFAMLHALDRSEFTAIAVTPIPETGLGAAINDRLHRAAAPRGAADENAA
ncbi:MAG: L-threonylcarbamoyladenylate synthase [Alphaproteobacteria bacterium]